MMTSFNRIRREWPAGTRVKAEVEGRGMQPGFITTHTENGLIVRFDDGASAEYPYGYIDIRNPRNSYVVATEY